MITQVNDGNFKEEVLDYDGVVIIDLYADWCGPCKMMAPIMEELDAETKDQVKVAKMDVDNSSATAARFNVLSIPTILIFKKGELVDQQVGVTPKQILQEKLASLS